MGRIISGIFVAVCFLTGVASPTLQAAEREVTEQGVRNSKFESTIGYQFRDPSLIDVVLSHAGVEATNQVPFGRMEFFGDKVLGLVLSFRLGELYPKEGEGWLSQALAILVSNENNARVADCLSLLTFAKLNPIHAHSGQGLQKIKADMSEALIGVIHADGGYESAEKFILTHWKIEPTLLPKTLAAVIQPAVVPVMKKAAPMKLENKGAKTGSKDAAKQLADLFMAHKLQLHQYKCHSENPFQVQLLLGEKPFTEVFQGPTKGEAKRLVALRALQIIEESTILSTANGHSKADLLKRLQEHATRVVGQGLKFEKSSILVGVSNAPSDAKVVVGKPPSQALTDISIKARVETQPVLQSIGSNEPVMVQSPPKLPGTVRHQVAKEQLLSLCESMKISPPTYTIVSENVVKIGTVTIQGYGSHKAQGANAQKLAAQEIYQKMTGKEVGIKEAKKALEVACGERKFGVPQYTTGKGEFKVRVTVGKVTAEGESQKSILRAEKLAAKKAYEILRRTDK